MIPFAFTDGGDSGARTLLPSVQPLLDAVHGELSRKLEWVPLAKLDPAQVEGAFGQGAAREGVLPTAASRVLAEAARASWVLMGELRREAHTSESELLHTRLELRLVLYDAQLGRRVLDTAVTAVEKQGKIPPTDPPSIPTNLRLRLVAKLREKAALQLLQAAFPPRVKELGQDGVVALDPVDGLIANQVLGAYEDRQSKTPFARLQVEFVGNGEARAKTLEGTPRVGAYVRPLDERARDVVAAAEPEEAEGAASRPKNTFLIKALALTVGLICIPLVITVILERRKPRRSAEERIRVTTTTKKSKPRAGAAA